jgi:deoxyribodipyrimidine photo-lyase
MKTPVAVFWFRRDLRLNDNAGLWQALGSGLPVLPVFVFDRNILEKLPDRADRRVTHIHRALRAMNDTLRARSVSLRVLHDTPIAAFEKLFDDFEVTALYTNEDYEPYARERDAAVAALCKRRGVSFRAFKDQVVFGKGDVLKADGSPYTVFTPYSRAWKRRLDVEGLPAYPSEKRLDGLLQRAFRLPGLQEIGFRENGSHLPGPRTGSRTLREYHLHRDLPGLDRTTRTSLPLRFGTLSIRTLARRAQRLNEKYLDELIWREFFMQVLWHFPHVTHRPFRRKYENLAWRRDEAAFEKWQRGETGYPLVDAGMIQLRETGFMHNRLRMVTANFLTRLLFIDWRWGEAWFAEKLADYELSSNNCNWQWSAGTGCDAAPWFRIFNPSEQQRRFDPSGRYIRQWIPRFDPARYRKPMVDYAMARGRALEAYKSSAA